MTWLPLLLADPSPSLRLLVLGDLLGRPQDDPEVGELTALREGDPLVSSLLDAQQADGSWGWIDPSSRGTVMKSTAMALARLGYLGLGPGHPAVQRGAEYLFARQADDGSWPLPGESEDEGAQESYSMIPLQTALPLWGLAACGYATDPRSERAYDWLLEQRLPEGAWPTGVASGVYRYVAGYRRIAHSRWGCRSNTTGALSCLALHPERRHSPEAQRALDLLLGRETKERHTLGFYVARLIGAEPVRGLLTFFARFDLAQMLDLCWRVGATIDDPRVASMVEFVGDAQGPFGLWEYEPGREASRWVTFDLLRALSRLDGRSEWLSVEPRTPFQPYPRRRTRY